MKQVQLHPESVKHINLGHPWIVADQFTEKFPKNTDLLTGVDNKGKFVCSFINDFEHPKVKGRVWSTQSTQLEFKIDVQNRLKTAIEKKLALKLNRDNYYLVFGEADLLPGLQILCLGKIIVIQCFSFFWTKHVATILALLKNYFQNDFCFYLQLRLGPQKMDIKLLDGVMSPDKLIVCEFGVKYKIDLNEKDFGLFTDMASIRQRITPTIQSAKSVLNLFAYTGAMSLFSLSLGCEDVVSVDLSKKYIGWIDENISLNPQINKESHQAVIAPVGKSLKEMDKKFDVIICDPPSIMTENGKKLSVAQNYQEIFPNLIERLNPNGTLFMAFNTHSLTTKKCEQIGQQLWKDNFKLKMTYKLSQDCPLLKGFQEGDYLKVFELKRFK